MQDIENLQKDMNAILNSFTIIKMEHEEEQMAHEEEQAKIHELSKICETQQRNQEEIVKICETQTETHDKIIKKLKEICAKIELLERKYDKMEAMLGNELEK